VHCGTRGGRAEHTKQAPAIQATAVHLEHQMAADHLKHELAHRETEAELVHRGVLHAGECGLLLSSESMT
jgi:hypothetical protein